MNCQETTLVRYAKGSNWDKGPQFYDGHIQFLAGQLKSGVIVAAGPTLDAKGRTEGGVAIYRAGEPAGAIAKRDPFVREGVVTAEAVKWWRCVAAQ